MLGDAYTFVGMERNTKLVLAWHLGSRNGVHTMHFIRKLRNAVNPQTLVPNDNGRLPSVSRRCRVSLRTSHRLRHVVESVAQVSTQDLLILRLLSTCERPGLTPPPQGRTAVSSPPTPAPLATLRANRSSSLLLTKPFTPTSADTLVSNSVSDLWHCLSSRLTMKYHQSTSR